VRGGMWRSEGPGSFGLGEFGGGVGVLNDCALVGSFARGEGRRSGAGTVDDIYLVFRDELLNVFLGTGRLAAMFQCDESDVFSAPGIGPEFEARVYGTTKPRSRTGQ